jgi:hypothetical protein
MGGFYPGCGSPHIASARPAGGFELVAMDLPHSVELQPDGSDPLLRLLPVPRAGGRRRLSCVYRRRAAGNDTRMTAPEHGTRESTKGLPAERIGRNDAIFREANERIRSAAEGYDLEGRVPFICECADPGCREIVQLTLDEYRDVRRNGRRFVNAPGHDEAAQDWAEVVEDHGGYVVVEKIGAAGAVAEQLEGEPDAATAPVEVPRDVAETP